MNLTTGHSPDDLYEVADASYPLWVHGGQHDLQLSDLSGGVRLSDPEEASRVKALAEAIGRNKRFDRIIVGTNGEVLEGQHRLEAARMLGLDTIPVEKVVDAAAILPVARMLDAIRSEGFHREQARGVVRNIAESVVDEGSVKAARAAIAPHQGQFTRAYDAAFNAAKERRRPARATGGFPKRRGF